MIDRTNGTNGELSIEEVLEKDPLIKELLDEDEVVEYISYKKGMASKLLDGILILIAAYLVRSSLWEEILSLNIPILIVIGICLSPVLFSLLLSIPTKLIVTNKGVIFRNAFVKKIKNKWSFLEKIYHFEISEVKGNYLLDFSSIYFKLKGKKVKGRVYSLFSSLKKGEVRYLAEIIEKHIKEDTRKR